MIVICICIMYLYCEVVELHFFLSLSIKTLETVVTERSPIRRVSSLEKTPTPWLEFEPQTTALAIHRNGCGDCLGLNAELQQLLHQAITGCVNYSP